MASTISPHSLDKQNILAIENSLSPSSDMQCVSTVVLGGGQGTRLFPLTNTTCKPAIHFGGRYRLIDIPISNAINSGCKNIFIVTQFLSSSLHQHVCRTYRFDSFSQGFIELISAEQTPKNREWYQGTADAVRQNLKYFLEIPSEYYLILSGDQLYNIDFRKMMQFARKTDADLVVSALPVTEKDAKRMGVMKIDESCRITDFYEKPQDKEVLQKMQSPTHCLKTNILSEENRPFLASMGIYLFKRDFLKKLLLEDPRDDFGKHIIPTAIQQGKTAAHLHEGYWEDIGTIGSFYEANMALTDAVPPFNCYDEENPIFSHCTHLPGPKIFDTQIYNSIICEGSVVEAEEIKRTILGPRSVVRKGSLIHDSYIMGNNFYSAPTSTYKAPETLAIGKNCLIKKAIIDKDVRIEDDVQLVNKNNLQTYDGKEIYIRDGIIIVPRGAHIPKGFVL